MAPDRRYGHRRMWLRLLVIALAVVAVSWSVMIVLAKRLPPGLAKDLATVLPACVTTARRLRRDQRVPRRVKVALLIAAVWVLSPIDLIPEFLPVIGPLDDIVVVALALRYAARRVPPVRARRGLARRTAHPVSPRAGHSLDLPDPQGPWLWPLRRSQSRPPARLEQPRVLGRST